LHHAMHSLKSMTPLTSCTCHSSLDRRKTTLNHRNNMPAFSTFNHRNLQYRNAIGRKGALEASLVFESELIPMNKPDQQQPSLTSSPVSIAAPHYVPEIQPISLPGAWTVVGKGGRPLKGKMYDEPKKSKKKKKAPRSRKAAEGEPLAALEEAPSSSTCLNKCERSSAKHGKVLTRARDAKHWARYQQDKAAKLEALNALLSANGDLTDGVEVASPVVSPNRKKPPHRNNKANSHAEKTRRANRFASAAARCYSPESSEGWDIVDLPPAKKASPKPGVKANGATTAAPTVAVPESSDKRKAESSTPAEESPDEGFKQAKASKKSKSSCSVM